MPASILEWGKQSQGSQRYIAQDHLFGFFVSTVFLGLNHQYSPGKPPLWFETMIFDRWKGDYNCVTGHPNQFIDLYVDRYTTREEALLGHQEAIEWLKAQPFFYQLALPWKETND